MKRRNFLHNLPLLSAIPLLNHPSIVSAIDPFTSLINDFSPDEPKDEAYWARIRSAFNITNDKLDLNSAGLSPVTKEILDYYINEIQSLYAFPSREQNTQRRGLGPIIGNLAELTNCKPTELVLQRNATEALSLAIFGVPLKPGDEVVVGDYDYPHMYYAWKQRAERDGIVLKYVDIGVSPKSPKKIIKKYLKEITPKTKAIFITDLVNYSGCQVPTKEIIQRLPDHVRYRIVDAAQSFANSRNDFKDFGATHVGTSLHKWLGTPVAAGLLFVQEEYIQETWPLFASRHPKETTIEKFAHLGTNNVANYSAIALAIQFYRSIGYENKYNRLIELSDYFVERAHGIKGLKILSPRHEKLKSNLVVFSIIGLNEAKIKTKLWKEYQIHVTSFDWKSIRGVRISPNIFTRKVDIDHLIQALNQLAD